MVDTSTYFRNKNNFLKYQTGIETSSFSAVFGSIKPLSQFTDYNEIKLPFVISGRLVSVGKYRDSNYGYVTLPEDELKQSLESWAGISIYSSHAVYEKVMRGEDVSINEILGKITKVSWNSSDPGIDFFAEIYDKNIAYKISNGLIKYVSVGFARTIVNKNREYYFTEIEPKEASLVFSPRDKKAEFKPA